MFERSALALSHRFWKTCCLPQSASWYFEILIAFIFDHLTLLVCVVDSHTDFTLFPIIWYQSPFSHFCLYCSRAKNVSAALRYNFGFSCLFQLPWLWHIMSLWVLIHRLLAELTEAFALLLVDWSHSPPSALSCWQCVHDLWQTDSDFRQLWAHLSLPIPHLLCLNSWYPLPLNNSYSNGPNFSYTSSKILHWLYFYLFSFLLQNWCFSSCLGISSYLDLVCQHIGT